MAKVLVVYGSRHGGTQGIAERIGEVLTSEGLEARVESAEHVRDIGAPDAVVIGSGVYMGRWLDAPVTFVERHAAEHGADVDLRARRERRLAKVERDATEPGEHAAAPERRRLARELDAVEDGHQRQLVAVRIASR
jgi:hypothetical protein